jgi:hypothetical protein
MTSDGATGDDETVDAVDQIGRERAGDGARGGQRAHRLLAL